jgi:hypothetical protein
MTPNPRPASWSWFFLFSVLFCAQVLPNILNNSPTDDEPIDLTNGYFYWAGDVVTSERHPPLAETLEALPLRLLGLNQDLPPSLRDNQIKSYSFLFRYNPGRFEEMTLLGRCVSLLFGLGIGFMLFWRTRGSPGVNGVIVLALWAFEPLILAYSGLAIADIPVTFFFLSAVLTFQSYLEKPGWTRGLLAGIFAGASVGSKFSALVLVPLFLLMQCVDFLRRGGPIRGKLAPAFKGWAAGTAGFSVFLCLLYLPGTLREPRHLPPWVYFWNGLMDMAHYSNVHHPTFFLGQASRQNHWLYFPLAFALKTTLPFFILFLASIPAAFWKKPLPEPWTWVPPLLLFLSILPVQNLGIRYLLPAYPFLFVFIANSLGFWWDWKNREGRPVLKLAFFGFLLWHTASTLASAPDMISYFNDLVPWQKKIYYLGDSNLDIGQDLKRLAQTARQRRWGKVKLAQFGGAIDPSIYGMQWDYWTEKDLTGPQPGQVYAVNVSLLQLGPEFSKDMIPIAKSWVTSTPITGRVGDTWIYFEIPGQPETDPSPLIKSVSVF